MDTLTDMGPHRLFNVIASGSATLHDPGRTSSVDSMDRYRLGSERGSPNHGSTLVSNRVHGGDAVADEGEDEEAGPMPDPGCGAQVRPERGLAVGACRHEIEPSA
jgi:hypothetical protein